MKAKIYVVMCDKCKALYNYDLKLKICNFCDSSMMLIEEIPVIFHDEDNVLRKEI